MRVVPLASLALASLTACQPRTSPDTPAPRPEPPKVVAEPAPAPQPEFVELAVETGYGCALHREGAVYCWGRDPALLLGLREPSGAWMTASIVEDVPKFTDIASHFLWTCGVVEDGTVMCWGQDDRQIHDRITIPLRDAVQVSADSETCARTANGGVYCWDFDRPEELAYVFDDAIDVNVGTLTACALDSAGGVWCWGGPEDETREQRLLARKVAEVPGAVEIEVGVYEFCVRRSDGEVLCSPRDDGEGLLELRPSPGLAAATQLARTTEHGCAVLEDGRAACFGNNGWAQLGDGTSAAREQAVVVAGLHEVAAVEVGTGLSCASDLDGIACWGTPMTEPWDRPPGGLGEPFAEATALAIDRSLTCVSDRAGELHCWGVTGIGDLAYDPYGIYGAAKPTRIALPGFGTLRKLEDDCLLDDQGELRCGTFGDRRKHQSSVADGRFTVEVSQTGVDDFASGTALCSLSKGKLRCKNRWTDEAVSNLPKLRKPTAITANHSTFYVIHDKGKLLRFEVDRDEDGKLRAGKPLRVGELTGIRSVFDLNVFGGCALDDQGKIWCWHWSRASNDFGEPFEVVGLPPVEQAVRMRELTCGLTSDAEVYCVDERDGRRQRVRLEDVVEIAGGVAHLCMRQADGVVTCVGENQRGELGTVPETLMPAPTRVELRTR